MKVTAAELDAGRHCEACIPVTGETATDPRWSVDAYRREWIYPTRPLRGWRFNSAAYHPDRGVKIADVLTLDANRTECGQFAPAYCAPPVHVTKPPPIVLAHGPVPDPYCWCGYNVVPRLAALLDSNVTRQVVRDPGGQDGETTFYRVLLRVSVRGAITKGAAKSDPEGTIRAAHVSMAGTVVVDHSAPSGVADVLTSQGAYVVVVPDLATCHEAERCPVGTRTTTVAG